MADEITLTCSLKLDNGNLKLNRQVPALRITQQSARKWADVRTIGVSYEQIPISEEITDLGYCLIRNLDDVNFVLIGLETGSSEFSPFCKIGAGEVAMLRLVPGITYYAQADYEPVDIDIDVLSD